MLKLYYYPSTAAMIPHIVLEELGVPYERVWVDRTRDAHKSDAYLRLNPNGLIPVLIDGDVVLYETAAIVLHLCDTHAQAALAPPVGSAQRAHFSKWLMWLATGLQTTLANYFYPERWLEPGNVDGQAQLRRHAEARAATMLGQLDHELAQHAEPWFLQDRYSALDAYVFTLCRWTRHFLQEKPARDWQHLGPYLQRVLARPAVQRVFAAEQLKPPWV